MTSPYTPNPRVLPRAVAGGSSSPATPLAVEPTGSGEGALTPLEAQCARLGALYALHRARRAHKPTKRLMARLRTLTAIAAKG